VDRLKAVHETLTSLLDDESVLRNHLSDTQPAGLREQLHSSADPLTASFREPIGPTLATPSSVRERIDLPLPPVFGGGLSDDSMRAAKARQLLIEVLFFDRFAYYRLVKKRLT